VISGRFTYCTRPEQSTSNARTLLRDTSGTEGGTDTIIPSSVGNEQASTAPRSQSPPPSLEKFYLRAAGKSKFTRMASLCEAAIGESLSHFTSKVADQRRSRSALDPKRIGIRDSGGLIFARRSRRSKSADSRRRDRDRSRV